MSNWGYIVLGWSVTGAALAAYAMRLVTRGRSLTRRVPEEKRRWMQ
jgi:hypothetical protein